MTPPNKTPEPNAVPSVGGVSLNRVVLRELHYEEIEVHVAPKPVQVGESMTLETDIGAQIKVFKEGMEMLVHATVVPDPKHQPFNIRTSIAGIFARESSVTDEQLLEFGSQAGIRILFPYIREIVSNISSRGSFGALWIDPLNMAISGQPKKVTEAEAKAELKKTSLKKMKKR